MIRCYRGVFIYPCEPNSSGMRWWALVNGAGLLRADTLDGIRRLIRQNTVAGVGRRSLSQ